MNTQTKNETQLIRKNTIYLIEEEIRWRRSPKLAMLFSLFLAGLTGFTVFQVTLKLSQQNVFMSYALALLCSYFIFYILIWLWVIYGFSPQAPKFYSFSFSDFGGGNQDPIFGAFVLIFLLLVLFLNFLGVLLLMVDLAPKFMAELTLDQNKVLQAHYNIQEENLKPYLYTFFKNTYKWLTLIVILLISNSYFLAHFNIYFRIQHLFMS
jgi:hypothetical protein